VIICKNGSGNMIKEFFKNGELKRLCYTDLSGSLIGNETMYFENGQVKYTTKYIDGVKEGKQVAYKENGELYSKLFYDNAKLIYAETYDGEDTIKYYSPIVRVNDLEGFTVDSTLINLTITWPLKDTVFQLDEVQLVYGFKGKKLKDSLFSDEYAFKEKIRFGLKHQVKQKIDLAKKPIFYFYIEDHLGYIHEPQEIDFDSIGNYHTIN
jgi:hypothetical protein